MSRMKISYNEGTASKCSTLEQDLQLCEQAGFDYIEIRFDMLEAYLRHQPLTALKRFFRSSRLKPHALNALYIPEELMEGPGTGWQKFADRFLYACDYAGAIGSGHIIVVAPMNADRITPYRRPWDQVKPRCREILEKLSDLAADSRTNICFELVGADYSGVRNIRQARSIVEGVASRRAGYVFDSFNIFMDRDFHGFQELEQVPPERIFMIHVNDSDTAHRPGLSQENRCFFGDDHLGLKKFINFVKMTGYDGPVSIEVFRPEYWERSPEKVIAEAYRTTRAALDLLT